MRVNKWTLGLAAVGLVSLPSASQAEEQQNQVWTALSSTTISGYVNTSAHWDIGTGNDNPPGFVYNSGKQDGFNLNVVKLTIERPLDESQWAAGYKVDLLFGPDANTFATASAPLGSATSDFAIRQAYVALRAPVGNGLDFKVGVFDSVIGYETHDAGNNPNYTRSYGTTIEPHTHTGVLASYQFTESVGVAFGIANTFGPAINSRAFGNALNNKAESYKTYMGSLALTAPEDWGFLAGSSLYGGVVNGFNNTSPGWVQTSWYVGATVATPIKELKLGASYDYAGLSEQDHLAVPIGAGYANATAIYASFQATEKLSLHARGEYFSQTDDAATTGLPSKVFAATATLQYDLWKNVLSRIEFRWDHQADGSGHAYGESSAADSLGGTKRNHYMLAANVIYKF
jgi:hypothetical protein